MLLVIELNSVRQQLKRFGIPVALANMIRNHITKHYQLMPLSLATFLGYTANLIVNGKYNCE
ncbi:hypothetical protein T09_6245, partial [Trichinella sp. T9]